MSMKISLAHAGKHFADIVRRISSGDEPVILTRRNRPVAALVSMEDLKRLREIEDRSDIEDARAARDEPGENIPWETLRKELDA